MNPNNAPRPENQGMYPGYPGVSGPNSQGVYPGYPGVPAPNSQYPGMPAPYPGYPGAPAPNSQGMYPVGMAWPNSGGPVPNGGSNSPQRRGPVWYYLLGALASIATIAGAVFGLAQIRANNSPAPSPTATVALRPSPTVTVNTDSYSAQVPGNGPGCDTGDGRWDFPTDGSTKAECTPAGMKVTNPAISTYPAEVFFTWPKHTFPQQYTVRADVALQANTCAGIEVLQDGYKGYSGLICASANWHIWKYDSVGTGTIVDSGQLSGTATSYMVEMIVTKDSVELKINDSPISTVTRDASYSLTSSLGLYVAGTSKIDGVAIFSDFVYSSSVA
jgi:hypothetical protein